jgi:hypothetical protein
MYHIVLLGALLDVACIAVTLLEAAGCYLGSQ